MTSFSSSDSLAVPSKSRRNNSSASMSTSMDGYTHSLGDAVPSSSSSLPLRAPLYLTRRHEYTERLAGAYSDDLGEAAFECATRSWHPWHPLPSYSPLPSLMSKFAAHAHHSDAPLSYGPPPLPGVPQTTYFYPQGDSAVADDGEEYDLESMDIHIHETYFATSAERGRWLSSPIAPRVRAQAIPPARGQSSPVKSLTNTSPRRELGHKIGRSVNAEIFTSPLEDRHEDVRYSSPLPPSSPLTSPMSDLSFLSDCDGDAVIDPTSNSDDCRSLTGTPELSISSTTCTSPVEHARTPTPHEVPTVIPTSQPTDYPCHPPHTNAPHSISRHSNPYSPKPIDFHVHAPGTTDLEPDATLSPLSQFDLDLPETEPPKSPLSDTVNKPHPGQHLVSQGVTSGVARSRDEPPSDQSLLRNLNCQPLATSSSAISGSGPNKKARRRSATGNAGARRTKKCAVTRSGRPSSDAKRSGAAGRLSNQSEPPSKRSKLSHSSDDFESRGAMSLPREMSKLERLSRSPSRVAVEVLESPHDSKPSTLSTRKTPVSIDAIDPELHASLTGMLVEALATSRATSMDASALYFVLTQAHPYLAAERPKGELLVDIAAVLETGRTRCGMFEKVDCSGERTRRRALESRWFYVPERDEDRERASLISALMPRQKRNETKKYKQYYYRPLDKISRWDPEDAP